MARIRSIKPEFPQSESIGRLSRDARLLFIQLWTLVDDVGRARAASRMLASLLYPYDDDAPSLIDGWLAELDRAGKVRLYEVDGSRYLDIPNWLEHQKIDHPSKSRLPEFRETSRNLAKDSETLAPDLGSRILDKDLGTSSLRSDVARERKRKPSSKVPFEESWQPKEGIKASEAIEFERFKNYAQAHDRRYADWDAAWRNWKTSPFQNRGQGPPAGNVPRPGSREDRQEKTANAIQQLSEFIEARADERGSSGDVGEAPAGLLRLVKPA